MATGLAQSEQADVQRIMRGLDTPQKRTIRAAEHLSVKDVLPKTFVNHTIIHENPSQDRLLGMEVDRIHHRRSNYLSNHEISRRTFLEQRTRNERKWKSQDELRISQMNFPSIRASAFAKTKATVDVLYRSPRYSNTDAQGAEAMLPYMSLRKERTEFIEKNGMIATTKLPAVIEIDPYKLQRYNTFCGQEFKKIKTGKVQRDRKFVNLMSLLSPLKLDRCETSDDPGLTARVHTSQSNTRPWYMSDSDSDVDETDDITKRTRDKKRNNKASVAVVFPQVEPKRKENMTTAAAAGSNVVKGHQAAVGFDAAAADPMTSLNRAQTQYNSLKPNADDSKDSARNAPKKPPKTAPETLKSIASSSDVFEGLTSPPKMADLDGGIITALEEGDMNQKEKVTRKHRKKVAKGILKGQVRGGGGKGEEEAKDMSVSEKRESIKHDVKYKDLRELMKKYGHLKPSNSKDRKYDVIIRSADDVNPRETNQFHSPTLERRFQVKSGFKKI